ncbi:unnamed protein product [Linum trigynum]|uniref:F-box domain-containing protein n=1 Tax=Linum trigynum TaxID=586398 RepID=A0AAV2GE49_9ROSI
MALGGSGQLKQLRMADRLGMLPDHVIERILKFLSIKDAAKTAMLSRKWSILWRNIPRLVFDDSFARITERGGSKLKAKKILMDIYKALLLHDGPIAKFVLAIPGLSPCDEIDHIVHHLANKGVKKLELLFGEESGDYPSDRRIHSSLFSAVQLSSLILEGACPLLEDLYLWYCAGASEIELVAPCLKVFLFIGYPVNIMFKCTPILSEVSILPYGEADVNMDKKLDMVALFASLPALEQLLVNFQFLKVLAASDHVPVKLPSLLHLRVLGIYRGHYGGPLETSVIFCLIRSSLRLHRLDLQMKAGERAAFCEPMSIEKECCEEDSEISCLREVYIQNSPGSQPELELVRFVFETSHQLQKLVIKASDQLGCEDRLKFLEEVVRYKRASTQAEVIYS